MVRAIRTDDGNDTRQTGRSASLLLFLLLHGDDHHLDAVATRQRGPAHNGSLSAKRLQTDVDALKPPAPE